MRKLCNYIGYTCFLVHTKEGKLKYAKDSECCEITTDVLHDVAVGNIQSFHFTGLRTIDEMTKEEKDVLNSLGQAGEKLNGNRSWNRENRKNK